MTELIKLSYAEIQIAYMVAGQRQIHGYKFGKHKYGAEYNNYQAFDKNLIGCLGEIAAAKYLDKYWWGTPGLYNCRDVGDYEVRATVYKKDTRLILHPDEEGAVWILALINDDCSVALLGWTSSENGKKQEFWCDYARTGRPAFFVPQSVLRPMQELRP